MYSFFVWWIITFANNSFSILIMIQPAFDSFMYYISDITTLGVLAKKTDLLSHA